MTITPISDIANRQLIEKSARQAADEQLGPQANMYEYGSPEFMHWLNVYNAQDQQNKNCKST